jgi:hypothetical protein
MLEGKRLVIVGDNVHAYTRAFIKRLDNVRSFHYVAGQHLVAVDNLALGAGDADLGEEAVSYRFVHG